MKSKIEKEDLIYNNYLKELGDETFRLKESYMKGDLSSFDYKQRLIILKEKLHSMENKVNETESILSEDIIDETYTDDELDKMEGKVYNQQKIINIYRRKKYNEQRLFAHTKCVKCGREKRVFLSNLVNDPDKYGSCICSDVNVKSRIDNIEDLYKGNKLLSNNTSGHTGVSFVKTYGGKPYNMWRAYIDTDGKREYLGDFKSKSKAIKAREKAARKGLKWYREHENEFMKDFKKNSKRYRSKQFGSKKSEK